MLAGGALFFASSLVPVHDQSQKGPSLVAITAQSMVLSRWTCVLHLMLPFSRLSFEACFVMSKLCVSEILPGAAFELYDQVLRRPTSSFMGTCMCQLTSCNVMNAFLVPLGIRAMSCSTVWIVESDVSCSSGFPILASDLCLFLSFLGRAYILPMLSMERLPVSWGCSS